MWNDFISKNFCTKILACFNLDNLKLCIFFPQWMVHRGQKSRVLPKLFKILSSSSTGFSPTPHLGKAGNGSFCFPASLQEKFEHPCI